MGSISRRKQIIRVFALIVGLTNTIALSAQAQLATPAETVLSFNPATVGVSASDAQELTASFTVTGYTGSFTPTAGLHYGRHYAEAPVNCAGSGGTETCTVSVSFQPTLPGGRKDALLLMDGATILSTVLLYGVGQSPLGLIQPGIVTQPILDDPDYLYQSAVDENGTVYVVSENSNAVLSLAAADVLTTLPIAVTSPSSIAVDGAGTLYFGQNTYRSSIVTYSATGVQGAISMVPPTPYVPCANSNDGTLEYLLNAAVDGLGNLFANEIVCTEVFELKADGSYVTTLISPAITQPSTMAVDSAGNLFFGGYSINELTTGDVQTQVNNVGALEGIAIDAAGTLYATRYTGEGGVVELAASDYASVLADLDPTASPLGVSVGPDGTVYVGNYYNLDKVDRSQGAIAFGEQSASTTSSPQAVAIYNGGNESLTLSKITITGTGFAMQAASTDNCVTGAAIPPGAFCQVAVTLTAPNAGIFSGTLAFTSNSLNTTTTQNVALSGFVYGVYVTPSPDPLAFGYQAVDTTSAERMVTLTNNGDLYSATLGTPSPSDPAFAPTLGTCTTSLAVGSSCQIGVTFAPTATQAYSGTVTLQTSSSGGGPNQTVTFNVSGTSVATSISDGGTEASIGADASADAADGSPDASDASMTTTNEEASTGTHDGAADGAPDASSILDSGSSPPRSDASTETPPASSSGGCGCRTTDARSNQGILPLVGFVALLTLRKRARRSGDADDSERAGGRGDTGPSSRRRSGQACSSAPQRTRSRSHRSPRRHGRRRY
jgi:MYXO-CTERM domain-containing protein